MERQQLRQIIIDQHQLNLPENFIARNVHDELEALQKTKQILVITGIRRSGKSTLLQEIRYHTKEKNYYFNFDDDRLTNFNLADFELLLELFVELYDVEKTVYFDEIQNIPEWERFVRRIHDQGYKIYITGSNATMFSQELGTRLTGRYIKIELYPFSFAEYVNWQKPELLADTQLTSTQKAQLQNLFAGFYENGGFPEFLILKNKSYLQNLFESILYRDIIVRFGVNERAAKELAVFLASNISSNITYNSLRKTLGLASATTVADYCSYLSNSYLCFFVNRFSYSLKEQIHYAKKTYFIDQALAKAVGFRSSDDFGKTLENIVFLELKRCACEIYFHKQQYECDFVLKQGTKIVAALQVCLSLRNAVTKKRELQGLIEAMENYGLTQGFILTKDDKISTEQLHHNNNDYTIHVIPIWRWLLSKNHKAGHLVSSLNEMVLA
ncbi:MAG: hypothetical protein ACD_21C00149G0002 [uncultured bacterium]|nr:MAG: hypothetical protein ACD_21C00149G0002 [uncultured bacterium]